MADEHILRAALRVLNATTLDMSPDPKDVEELKKCADGPESALPPKALAIYIFQQELEAKRIRRASGK